MDEINKDKVFQILNSIMKLELAGIVRYTHYALMVTGPYRLPLEDFLKLKQLNPFFTLRRREKY